MAVLRKSNKKSSARQQIDMKGARDGVLILPRNKYRSVLSVSSINFELKSEAEQDTIIDTYESFLNSVGCPLQILIRTREIDLDKYLSDLNERLSRETVPIYKQQLAQYNEFIRGLIATSKILTRSFYVVIPYDAPRKLDFDACKQQLGIRTDIVQKGFARLGMQSHALSSLEVLDLFYSFYNPQQAKVQPLSVQALELLYTSYMQTEPSL